MKQGQSSADLQVKGPENEEQHRLYCNDAIKFYELLSMEDPVSVGNAVRYNFTPPDD